MIEQIQALLSQVHTLQAHDTKELEALRIKYLSKKGIVADLMTQFRSVPAEQKREVGMLLNQLKDALDRKSVV